MSGGNKTITAEHKSGDKGYGLLAAGERLYRGCAVGVNSLGYLVSCAHGKANILAFCGIAERERDNTDGADGDKNLAFYRRGVRRMKTVAATQAWVGDKIYQVLGQTSSQDETVSNSTSGLTTSICVGQCIRYDSATVIWVDIEKASVPSGT